LITDYTHVDNWPTPSKKLGAISAVALDVYKNVVVFHRFDRIWNSDTFDSANNYRQQYLGPIKESTIVTFDRQTGNVIKEWGENLFYMPHGLHINGNYYYITDVGKRERGRRGRR
jgi:peptidylamidoglycolate lyase